MAAESYGTEADLRHEAIQIASQLPRNRKDALRVLALTRLLVVWFLNNGSDPRIGVVNLRSVRNAEDQEPT